MKKVILASGSPRRREILQKLHVPFVVERSDYEEDMTLPLSPRELVQHLALEKAKVIARRHPRAVIIAADTVVALGKKIFGKPGNEKNTRAMLRALSGKTHDIFTGFAVMGEGRVIQGVGETRVTFRKISVEEMRRYARSSEAYEKAGAYDLWGFGSIFIKKVEGDILSGVGLPPAQVRAALSACGVKVK